MHRSITLILISTIYKIRISFYLYLMKYNQLKYLSFALWALALPACSSVENVRVTEYGDDIIRFAAPTIVMGAPEVNTRATLLNTVTENTTFGVFGYCVPYSATEDKANWANGTTEWAGKKAFSHADVMYNQPIYYDGAKCVYRGHENDPDLPRHWYTQADVGTDDSKATINFGQFKYTFIAYHPYSQQGHGGFSIEPADAATRGIPQLSYTMPYSAATDRGRELNIDVVEDVMWAMKTDHLPGSGGVELEFRHVLTGLRLQVNNYNPVDDTGANTVTLHSITLEGDFYRSATIDFALATPEMTVGADWYSGTFHFLKDDASWEVPANSGRIVGSTPGKADGTTILLLPNAKAKASVSAPNDPIPYLGANKTITVVYSYPGEAKQTKHVRNFSLGRIPEQGICYTLNLNFVGNQLLLMFTADSIEYWEAGSDNDIIIN